MSDGTPNLVVPSVNTRWQMIPAEIERERCKSWDVCSSKAAVPEEGQRNTSSKSYLGVEGGACLFLILKKNFGRATQLAGS